MAKIKVKTKSAAKKRFKKISKKLVKRGFAGRRHLMTGKAAKTKRHLRKAAYVNGAMLATVLKMLPY